MKRLDFCKDWIFTKAGGEAAVSVDLPHDAMIHEPRDPKSAGGAANAYFPGGVYIYKKAFFVPADWQNQSVMIEFEGVYRNSKVTINGIEAGGRPYGYIDFLVDTKGLLKYGEDNIVRVEVDNSKLPNSRWYSGSGIHRPVSLLVGGRSAIEPDGVRITTLSVRPARIQVETQAGEGQVRVEILKQGEVVASGTGRRLELEIDQAELWSADHPFLYDCRVRLDSDGEVLDEAVAAFGIRQIEWSPKGLAINGEQTLLRGGCVHHDNGVLGACSFPKAEARRVRIMKQAGFNAIRSSHYPASRSLIEACDRQGMYLIDETWDMWYMHKNKYDYASDFMAWYERDVRTIVARDYNHPSVIMYSIGNEVSEPYEQQGVEMTKKLVDLFHELDTSRPVTGGINLMIIKLASQGKGIYGGGENSKKDKKTGSLLFNMLASMMGPRMNKMANSSQADRVTSPCLDLLDIAGYNYASGRYKLEGSKHPDRIVVGAETFPVDIYDNWQLVKQLPYLVGDFMWAGWDYLGEVGIGGWAYDKSAASFEKPYPWLLAGPGVIDILGKPDAQAAYAGIVWGEKKGPFIGVRPVSKDSKKLVRSIWRWTNAVDSWAWQGCEGRRADVEVYANAFAVELLINGRSIGRKKLKSMKATFKTTYTPGSIQAIAYDRSGVSIGQQDLQSATGKIGMRVTPEDLSAVTGELVFVNVELAGENGIVESNADQKLKINIEGGRLLGFGSANPCTDESFNSGLYTTYFGRAMAVITADRPGTMRIRVSGEGLDEAGCEIQVRE